MRPWRTDAMAATLARRKPKSIPTLLGSLRRLVIRGNGRSVPFEPIQRPHSFGSSVAEESLIPRTMPHFQPFWRANLAKWADSISTACAPVSVQREALVSGDTQMSSSVLMRPPPVGSCSGGVNCSPSLPRIVWGMIRSPAARSGARPPASPASTTVCPAGGGLVRCANRSIPCWPGPQTSRVHP